MGQVASIVVRTNQGEEITLNNVHLEVEVDTETISHYSMGQKESTMVMSEKMTAKVKTDDIEAVEELYRLVRED